MTYEELIAVIPRSKMESLSKEELILVLETEQMIREKFENRVSVLEAELYKRQQISFLLEEKLVLVRSKLFDRSSEKSETIKDAPKKEKKVALTRVRLPSERYPNTPIVEKHIELKDLPSCNCCGSTMQDSGLTEDSECLTVEPAKYTIIRQLRHKYRCKGCQSDIQTAPSLPRITPGSSLSDEMMIDVSLSKFLDLLPIQRYAAIAGRAGLKDLPTQSLIEATHSVAEFIRKAYDLVRDEVLLSRVLHADETPHRMLEGDPKSHWYLWGFSNTTASYFEIRDTRSGDVAIDLLKDSQCEFLVSDVYSGYNKTVRKTNEYRDPRGLPRIRNCYCNAHARRKFVEAEEKFPNDAKFYIEEYRKIYLLNTETKDKPPDETLEIRAKMKAHFEAMRHRAYEDLPTVSDKSGLARAINYFLKNLESLTIFLENAEVPIDNNAQERLLRNPVIGRKTWYGTHSHRGAETAAIIFTLVETCKLNGINPRAYFKSLVETLHQGKPAFSPSQFKSV